MMNNQTALSFIYSHLIFRAEHLVQVTWNRMIHVYRVRSLLNLHEESDKNTTGLIQCNCSLECIFSVHSYKNEIIHTDDDVNLMC